MLARVTICSGLLRIRKAFVVGKGVRPKADAGDMSPSFNHKFCSWLLQATIYTDRHDRGMILTAQPLGVPDKQHGGSQETANII